MKDSTRNKYAGQNDQYNSWKKFNRTDSYLLQVIFRILKFLTKCFLVSLFQLLLFHCPRKTFEVRIHSLLAGHYTGGVLIVRGVGIFPQI